MKFRCPKCKSEHGLYVHVDLEGWQSVDTELKPVRSTTEREAFWEEARSTGQYGCGECGWEGQEKELERISGVGGEPLDPPGPEQSSLSMKQGPHRRRTR
jgi:hypothetical protein